MDRLVENLLEIHEIMSSATNFIKIRFCIEGIDKEHPHYKRLVQDTNILVQVLKKFSEQEL